MKKTLVALVAVLIAVVVFVFGFRVGRLYSSTPMRVEYDPVERFNGRNLKVELIQARNVHNNKIASPSKISESSTNAKKWYLRPILHGMNKT
jgi:hypothetical protein